MPGCCTEVAESCSDTPLRLGGWENVESCSAAASLEVSIRVELLRWRQVYEWSAEEGLPPPEKRCRWISTPRHPVMLEQISRAGMISPPGLAARDIFCRGFSPAAS